MRIYRYGTIMVSYYKWIGELVSCDKCAFETTIPFTAHGALLLAIPGCSYQP